MLVCSLPSMFQLITHFFSYDVYLFLERKKQQLKMSILQFCLTYQNLPKYFLSIFLAKQFFLMYVHCTTYTRDNFKYFRSSLTFTNVYMCSIFMLKYLQIYQDV